MKTRNVLISSVFIVVITVLFTQSCTKEDQGNISTTDLSLAQDETYADALFEEVDNIVGSELTALDGNGYTSSAKKTVSADVCYTVTVDHPDSTFFPKKVYIDFGEGCQVVFKGDTIVRKGQIIITVTDRWYKTGAKHIVSFHNFYLNGVKIEGIKTTENLGFNTKKHLRLGIVLEGGKLYFNDTTMMTRESDHVREIIRRLKSQNDTILVSGTAAGTNVLGETYNREITEPLVLVHCADQNGRWVVAGGVVQVTNSKRGTIIIDHTGSGCDGNVVINKNGTKHNYKFKYAGHKNKG